MSKPLRDLAVRFPVLGFLGLTFLLTWACVVYLALGLSGRLGHVPSELWLALVGQFGPLWAALALVGLQAGGSGVKALLKGLLDFRMEGRVWAVVLLAAPAQIALACAVYRLGGGHLDLSKVVWPQVLGGMVGGTLVGLVFGGLSEEVGWRGYLLPRLQRRWHPAVAGALVGLVWSFWHLDPDVLATLFSKGWEPFLAAWGPYQGRYLTETVPMAVFMAALFNRGGGRVLPMMVFHAQTNALVVAFWPALKPIPLGLRLTDLGVICAFALTALLVWRAVPVQRDAPGTEVG